MGFLKTLREECHWLHSMMAKLCARCTACAGKSDKNATPCTRHGKPACRHYDCAHYIPLNSRFLCCRPGCPVPRKPLKPWIQVSLLSSMLFIQLLFGSFIISQLTYVYCAHIFLQQVYFDCYCLASLVNVHACHFTFLI